VGTELFHPIGLFLNVFNLAKYSLIRTKVEKSSLFSLAIVLTKPYFFRYRETVKGIEKNQGQEIL